MDKQEVVNFLKENMDIMMHIETVSGEPKLVVTLRIDNDNVCSNMIGLECLRV